MPFFAMPDFLSKNIFCRCPHAGPHFGEKKNAALSFDDDFKAMGLTTIS
jgi:hypothetical protein